MLSADVAPAARRRRYSPQSMAPILPRRNVLSQRLPQFRFFSPILREIKLWLVFATPIIRIEEFKSRACGLREGRFAGPGYAHAIPQATFSRKRRKTRGGHGLWLPNRLIA